ncbi:MAG TPA: BamA/TamA family outer membrane protein [Gemmatimonadales bacterium]|nr:BamA/TamA family outer membrane protein [Gemmatimonadales bacterium]
MASLLLLAALPLVAPPVAAQSDQERVVRKLSFAGNRALDDYTLSAAIATTNSSWAATWPIIRLLGFGEKRTFDETEFRRDVVRLVLLYRQSGYMSAVVDTVVRREPKNVFITFRIHEGDPVRVARLEVKGVAGILDTAKLRRALPLQVGDPFNRFLFQASADTIVVRLRNSGYPYAEVLRNFDSEAGILRAEVELEAIPGRRMRIGEVQIRGLEALDTGVVRRILTVHPGDLYRQDALYQSQRELFGLGVFRSASVLLVDSLPPVEGSGGGQGAAGPEADSTVRVLVQVVEGPRHRLRLGAGYGSVECFRVQTGWAAHNFQGGARVLDLSARVSKLGGGDSASTKSGGGGLNQLCNPFAASWTLDTLNYTVGVALRQPAFLSRAHTATVGLFAERRSEFHVYTREAVGVNADVTINARRAVPVTLGYGYSVGRITKADAATFCSRFRLCTDSSRAFLQERRPFGAVSVTAVRDRVNNPLDASEGSLVTATLLHASRAVGSKAPYEFNRGELDMARYYPIGRRTVFAWRLRGGTILPQDITLLSQRVGYVPPDQRFYGGGPNSVRGYGLNELGPRVYIVSDTNPMQVDTVIAGQKVFKAVRTVPTGGNSVVVLNAELRFPSPIFAQRMRLGLFVDVGRVWERTGGVVSLDSLRVTPGVGVRITTPLGPVRVDAAYNGYPAERGPLLFQTPTDSIIRIRPTDGVSPPDDYPPPGGRKRFWDRIVWQFAVGQAF